MTELPRRWSNSPDATASPPRTRTGPADSQPVAEPTLVAVLAALGVAAATEEERAAALSTTIGDHWRRSLPPTIVARAGQRRRRSGCMSPTAIPSACGCGLRTARCAPGLRQLENNRPPYRSGRPVGRRGHLRAARRPAARATTGARAGRLGRHQHRAHRHAGLAGAARALGSAPDLGAGHPALQRALRKIVGHRRSDRPHRPGGVVGGAPRRRIHAGQPAARRRARSRRWSRRRTCRPRGASSTRSTCGSRRSPSSPTSSTVAGCARRGRRPGARGRVRHSSTATRRGRPSAPR